MDELIATIPKNKLEEVRVGIDEFKGHDLVSMRVWADPYGGDERVPTKKGLSVRVQLLPDLITALQEAEKEARAAGMFGAVTKDQAA